MIHHLKSLAPEPPKILEAWLDEAERRAESIESGREEAIPGEEVFAEIRARFERA